MQNSNLTDKVNTTLAYGRAGFKIFPIREGTKDQPLIRQWGQRASSDAAKITAWWMTVHPRANIGLACMASGICVVDSDMKPGGNGEDTLGYLAEVEGKILSPTRAVRTPSGGIHRFYRGALATSVQRIGPHVDTRGTGGTDGGYVVLPPSRTEVGIYEWINDLPIAPVDAWVVEMCGGGRPTNRAASQEPVIALDQDSNIRWAREWLRDAPKCCQGAGGDKTLLFIVATLKDHGISEDMAGQIIGESGGYNETRCEPPWLYGDCEPRDNLYVKIRNAYLYCHDRAPGSATAEADFASTNDEDLIDEADDEQWIVRRRARRRGTTARRRAARFSNLRS